MRRVRAKISGATVFCRVRVTLAAAGNRAAAAGQAIPPHPTRRGLLPSYRRRARSPVCATCWRYHLFQHQRAGAGDGASWPNALPRPCRYPSVQPRQPALRQQENIAGPRTRNRSHHVHEPFRRDRPDRPYGAASNRLISRRSSAYACEATYAVIPLPIRAGVFGIQRTTRFTPRSRDSIRRDARHHRHHACFSPTKGRTLSNTLDKSAASPPARQHQPRPRLWLSTAPTVSSSRSRSRAKIWLNDGEFNRRPLRTLADPAAHKRAAHGAGANKGQ